MSTAPEPALHSTRNRWFLDEVYAHEASLRSYLRSYFPSIRDVDDVVQESYLRVWKARASVPIRSAKSFLLKVARHVAIDLVRHDRVSPVDEGMDITVLSVSNAERSAVDVACTSDEIALLALAIDTLPARCREIVILRKLHGVSQKEIAARLGISEQTVQGQASRGMKRIETYFSEHAQRARQRVTKAESASRCFPELAGRARRLR